MSWNVIKTALILGLAVVAECGPVRGEILIGLAAPLSGPLAGIAAKMVAGANQAMEDINAHGGIRGERVALQFLDEENCDPAKLQTLAGNAAVNYRVRYVVGHGCSAAAVVAARIYAANGIPFISTMSTLPALTDSRAGPGIFRICGRSDQQAEMAGRLLASLPGDVAIVHNGTPFGQDTANRIRSVMNQAGKTERFFQAFSGSDPRPDISAIVSRMRSDNIGEIFVAGTADDVRRIREEMRQNAVPTIVVAGDSAMAPGLWSDSNSARGLLMTSMRNPKDNVGVSDLVSRLRQRNIQADSIVLHTYAAFQIYAQAANSVRGAQDLAGAIQSGRFDTVLGTVAFDQRGDRNGNNYVWYGFGAAGQPNLERHLQILNPAGVLHGNRYYLLFMLQQQRHELLSFSIGEKPAGTCAHHINREGRMLTGDIELELQAATCAVAEKTSGNVRGTAIVISRDGLAITAAHVIESVESAPDLVMRFEGGQVNAFEVLHFLLNKERGQDFALCRIRDFQGNTHASPGFPRNCKGEMVLRGYGKVFSDQTTAAGSFLGTVDIDGRDENRLFHFQSTEAGDPGFSGSGVYARLDGAIVGVQTEAADVKVGPQRNSVLAYPLFHVRNDILSKVSLRTRLAWFVRSTVRSILFRPTRYAAFAISLLTAVSLTWFSVMAINTEINLRVLGSEHFQKLNAEETAFWASSRKEFEGYHNAKGQTFHQALFDFLKDKPIVQSIYQLADYHDGIAKCVTGGSCLGWMVCLREYKRIWDFYHAYQGLWPQVVANGLRNPMGTAESFLKRECPGQLNAFCDRAYDKSNLCPPR